MLAVTLWNWTVLPLRFVFLEGFILDGPEYNVRLFVLDCVLDALLALDTALRWRTEAPRPRVSSIVMPEAEFGTRPAFLSRVAPHEARDARLGRSSSPFSALCVQGSGLMVDVLAALPLDVVLYFCVPGLGMGALGWRALKLLGGLKQSRYLVEVLWVTLERRRIVVNSGLLRAIYLGIVFVWSCHVGACVWFHIGWLGLERFRTDRGGSVWDSSGLSDEEQDARASWAAEDGLLVWDAALGRVALAPGVSVLRCYVRSLGLSIGTLSSVGDAVVVTSTESWLETAFGLLCAYLGLALTATTVGCLTNMMNNLDVDQDEFRDKLDTFEDYMVHRKLGAELRVKIRAYMGYAWASRKGVDEAAFLRELPVSLRLQVLGLQAPDMLRQVPYLRKANDALLAALCLELEQVIVPPGEPAVKAGQAMLGCFFLLRGQAEVRTAQGTVLQRLSSKEQPFFGEASLFAAAREFENEVRAHTYCELLFLGRAQFVGVLSKHLSDAQFLEMKEEADKAAKRTAKVKKFFGLEASSKGELGWRAKLFEPTSRFREAWNLIMLAVVAHAAVLVPLDVASMTLIWSARSQPAAFAAHWAVDALVLADVVMRATCFSFVHEGVVHRDRALIWAHYRRNGPWVTDMLLVQPLDLVIAMLYPVALPYARLPKFLVVRFAPRLYDTAREYLVQRGLTLSDAMHRLVKIVVLNALLVHVCAACFLWSGSWSRYLAVRDKGLNESQIALAFQATGGCELTDEDWICMDAWRQRFVDHNAAGVTYLRALFVTVLDTLTVGYGGPLVFNTLETAYEDALTIGGSLGFPFIIAAMSSLVGMLGSARGNFRRRMQSLSQYMADKNFPAPLRTRITRYYDFMWERQRGTDEQTIIKDLPRALQIEVQACINGGHLRSVPFFAELEKDVFERLCSSLAPRTFLPGDMIIQCGELSDSMFLLERGATQVTSADGAVTYAVLSAGDYFGERALLGATRSAASVLAIGYCDSFALSKEAFEDALQPYPRAKRRVLLKLELTIKHKAATNAAVTRNRQEHPKLAQLTSNAYAGGAGAVPTSSLRHPESGRKQAWDLTLLVVVLYNLFAVPFRVSFATVLETLALDWLGDCFLVADAWLRYSAFAFIEDDNVVSSEEEIKARYRASGAVWRDLITALPLDLVAVAGLLSAESANSAERDKWLMLVALLRLPKLLHLSRGSALVRPADLAMDNSRHRGHSVAYVLFKLTVMVLAVAHWGGCGYYLTARYWRPDGVPSFEDCCAQYVGEGGEGAANATLTLAAQAESDLALAQLCEYSGTWVQSYVLRGLLPYDCGTLFERYVRVMEWALPTLMVVVIGDLTPLNPNETIYVVVVVMFALVINAAVIGNMANLVANVGSSLEAFRVKIDTVEHFLNLHKVPQPLRRRTRTYLEYIWAADKGVRGLIDDMPATLYAEVSDFLKLGLVANTPFFEACEKAMQKWIAARLISRVFSPGDFIIHEGDVGTDMYFIERGSVQLLTFRTNWRNNFAGEATPSTPAASSAATAARLGRGGGGGGGGSSNVAASSSGRRESLNTLHARGLGSSKIAPADSGPSKGGELAGSPPAQPTPQPQRVSSPGAARRVSLRRLSNTSQSLVRTEEVNEADVIVLNSLRAGQFFGETAIFFNERRACSARAMDFSELFLLSREQLDLALTRFPNDADKMFAVVLEYRAKNSARNESVRANLERAKVKGIVGGRGKEVSHEQLLAPGQLSQQSTWFARTFAFRRGQSVKVAPAAPFGGGESNATEAVPPASAGGGATSSSSSSSSLAKRANVLFKPDGSFHMYWNACALLGALYLCWSVPYRAVFLLEPAPGQGVPWTLWAWLALDWAIDLFFLADVALRYRYFAFIRLGYVVTDRDEIAAHYRSSWMLVDCVACVPLELMALALALLSPSPSSMSSLVVALSSCRLIKLLRTLKLPYYMRFVEQHLNEVLANGLSSAVMQIVQLVGLLVIMHHYFACGWFAILRWVPTADSAEWRVVASLPGMHETLSAQRRGFLGHHELFDRDSDYDPWFCYLRALFFTVASQGAVGFGGVRPIAVVESAWQLVVLFVGCITFAGVIGSMAVLYQRWDTSGKGTISIKNKLRKVIEYMRHRELPVPVQRDIVNFLASSWELSHGLNMRSVLQELPAPLQLDLAIWVHRPIIRAVKGLRSCHARVQRHIALKLTPQVRSKGDCVYREGDIGSEIYFILAGTVRIGASELGRGQHFGGSTLYSPSGLRTETVRCETDCELYLLGRNDFERIMIEFPEHRDVGIFAELTVRDKHTVLQARELRRQVAEISGNVKNSPLAALTARHIDTVLGGLDTSSISGVRASATRTTKLLVPAGLITDKGRKTAVDDLVCGKRKTTLTLKPLDKSPGKPLDKPLDKPRDIPREKPRDTLKRSPSQLDELKTLKPIDHSEPVDELGHLEQLDQLAPIDKLKQAVELVKPDINSQVKHNDLPLGPIQELEEDRATAGDIGDVYAAFLLKKTGKARNKTNERRSVTFEDAEHLLRTRRRGPRDDDGEPSGNAYTPMNVRRDRKGHSESGT